MSTSPRAFRIDLYKEHLEEAAFLYQQRLVLLVDPEFSWMRLADFEGRLEAHIDALVVGGDLALVVCRERIAACEAAELFVMACLACRHQDTKFLNAIWQVLDFADESKVGAIQAALNWELPASWEAACAQATAQPASRLFPVLAPVCGYRRIDVGERIAEGLLSRLEGATAGSVLALSKLKATPQTHQALIACCKSANPAIQEAAALGMLRVDIPATMRFCRPLLQTEDWPQVILALAGDRDAATALRRRVEAGAGTPMTVQALGLLGDVSVVRSLCMCLSTEALAEAAVWALYWITGAVLFERKLQPETVKEDELFPKELAAWRERGEAPKRADGHAYGAIVRKLSNDVGLWEQWLKVHSREFHPDVRYRRGRPYSPMVVVDCIADSEAPHFLRSRAIEELAVRYACPIVFEADWRVVDQSRTLGSLRQWALEAESGFEPGAW